MTTQAEQASIRTEVVVEAPIERAFGVFSEQFDKIKPREHNMLEVDIAESVFEPREGGRVYDRGVDGSECQWARVLAYEPPDRIVFTWDISPRWQIERTSHTRARSRCASFRRPRSAPGSSSSIAISTGTARAGKACAKASAATRVGRSISGGSPIRLAGPPEGAIAAVSAPVI